MSARKPKRLVAGNAADLTSPAGGGGTDRYETLGVAVLLLGALLVRLPNLDDSLWFDELWRTRLTLTGDSLRFVLFHDTHPPLFVLILWGWIHVFGDSEIAVRVPSLLCGLASIAVTFALAKRWFGRRVAFLAGGLLALSPAHIWYSHENKNNMLLVLLTVGALWGLDRAWRSDRRQDWCVFLSASALALWTNLFAAWSISAAYLWLWFQVCRKQGGRHRLRRAVTATLTVTCAFLPLAVWDVSQNSKSLQRTYLRPFTLAEVYKLLLIYLSHGNTLRTVSPYAPLRTILLQPAPWFFLDAFFACLLMMGLAWVIRRGAQATSPPRVDRAAASLLLFSFFVPLLAVWVASRIYPAIYIERSMLIVLVPYVMLLAAGVFAIPRPALRYATLATLLVLNGWALFNLWIAKADTWTVYKPKNDWRAAAQYLGSEIQDTTPLLIFATAPASVLIYYDRRFDLSGTPDQASPGAKAFIVPISSDGERSLVDWLRRDHTDTCYLLEDRYWGNGFDKLLAAVRKDPSFQPLAQRSFKGLNVFKFRWLAPP